MAILLQDRIAEIEARAADVLVSTFGTADVDLPVDLGAVAKSEGIQLKEAVFKDDDAIGLYERGEKKIYVKRGSHLPRMSFTIAHEIGHHILHEDIEEETFWRRDILSLEKQDPGQETEANWFAASLLMPKIKIELYWSKIQDIDALADIFGVSRSAMLWRLKNMKLL